MSSRSELLGCTVESAYCVTCRGRVMVIIQDRNPFKPVVVTEFSPEEVWAPWRYFRTGHFYRCHCGREFPTIPDFIRVWPYKDPPIFPVGRVVRIKEEKHG